MVRRSGFRDKTVSALARDTFHGWACAGRKGKHPGESRGPVWSRRRSGSFVDTHYARGYATSIPKYEYGGQDSVQIPLGRMLEEY